MVEVQEISKNAAVPADKDHVLIELNPSGKFAVNGSVVDTKAEKAKFFYPLAFATLDEAIDAAKDWASQNGVPVIYIRQQS